MIILRLKELAEQKNINRHQLSLRCGVSYPTIQKYWAGQVKSIDLAVLDLLCHVLACEPGDLLKRV